MSKDPPAPRKISEREITVRKAIANLARHGLRITRKNKVITFEVGRA